MRYGFNSTTEWNRTIDLRFAMPNAILASGTRPDTVRSVTDDA